MTINYSTTELQLDKINAQTEQIHAFTVLKFVIYFLKIWQLYEESSLLSVSLSAIIKQHALRYKSISEIFKHLVRASYGNKMLKDRFSNRKGNVRKIYEYLAFLPQEADIKKPEPLTQIIIYQDWLKQSNDNITLITSFHIQLC